MAHYSYEPLQHNQIRLFSLLPGTFGDELRCFLTNVELPPADASHRSERGQDSDSGLDSETHTSGRKDSLETGSDEGSTDDISNDQDRSDGDETVDNRSITRAPLYEAISYVWGPQEPHRFLHVEGKNTGRLVIGPNLHDALQRLRASSNHKARVLWADQICINQADLEERSAQVRRMKDIYRSARTVQVWLGEEDKYTALGFDFVKRLQELTDDGKRPPGDEAKRTLCLEFSDRISQEYMDDHMRHFGNYLESPAADANFADGLFDGCLAVANSISYRSWFERTWTFQEVILAHDAVLVCGGHSIVWKLFEGYINSPNSNSLLSSIEGAETLELWKFRWPSELACNSRVDDIQSFTKLLSNRRQSTCQDPRDKVIALLGILDDLFIKSCDDHQSRGLGCPSDFIKPSYEEPADSIFAKTAHYLVRRSRTLDILWHVDSASTQDDVLSWAPDWSPVQTAIVAPEHADPMATLCSPYPEWLCRTPGDNGYQELMAAAVKQDTIKNLACSDGPLDTSFFNQSTNSDTYPLTLQPIQAAAKQMMLRDRWRGTFQAARATFLGLKPRNEDNEYERIPGWSTKDQVQRLERQIKLPNPDYKVFCGENGSIGYGPRSLQTGDEIHLLLGLDVPVALRRTDSGYRFTGLCYVQGLGHGEGLHPSRKPQACYYPGSSDVDEVWVLDRRARRVKQDQEREQIRWESFESRTEALEWFRSNSPDLWRQGWLADPSWSPADLEFAERSIWLLEKGLNPVPIMAEEITLV